MQHLFFIYGCKEYFPVIHNVDETSNRVRNMFRYIVSPERINI